MDVWMGGIHCRCRRIALYAVAIGIITVNTNKIMFKGESRCTCGLMPCPIPIWDGYSRIYGLQ